MGANLAKEYADFPKGQAIEFVVPGTDENVIGYATSTCFICVYINGLRKLAPESIAFPCYYDYKPSTTCARLFERHVLTNGYLDTTSIPDSSMSKKHT